VIAWLEEIAGSALTAVNEGNIAALFSLFLITGLTEIGIPFPYIVDTVLFVSSCQSRALTPQLGVVVLVVFLGRHFGSSVIYWLTRILGNALLSWMSRRFPRFHKRYDRVTYRIHRRAVLGIAITRLMQLLTLASVASGAIKVRYHHFLLGVTMAAIIFDGALIGLGILAGHGLRRYDIVPSVLIVILGFIVVIGLVYGSWQLLQRRRNGQYS
jgi:membrane protein DedA with SNARE-associated domain